VPLGTSTEPVYGVHLCNSGLPQISTIRSNTRLPFTTNFVFGTGSPVTLTELNGPGYDEFRKSWSRGGFWGVRILSWVCSATKLKTLAPTSRLPRVGKFQLASTVAISE
jgi:hypothetical protein